MSKPIAVDTIEDEKAIEKLTTELHLKQQQLNSLLQISEAVNQNFTRHQLLSIYEFVLRNQLKISRTLLFTHDEQWELALHYGVDHDFTPGYFAAGLVYTAPEQMLEMLNNKLECKFEQVIPVFHKKTPLAYAFLGPCTNPNIDFNGDLLPFIQTITNMVMVALENKKLYKDAVQQAATKRELALAAQMQSMLFPEKLPQAEGIDMSAINKPYEEIGGDYYDYIRVGEHEFLTCMADVSGKGIAAALLMSNFQATLRALARNVNNLEDLMEALNKTVIRNAKGEKFITCFLCKFNVQTRQLEYVNAGHNPPILLGEDGEVTLLEEGTTGLGMFEKLPFMSKGTNLAETGKEYIMTCYTDGVIELENEEGEQYGLERLISFVKENAPHKTSTELRNSLMEDLDAFRSSKPYTDDISVLAVKCRF